MSLATCPITLREAFAFVASIHRHHRPPRGGVFAIGAVSWHGLVPLGGGLPTGERIVGVVIVGRPVSRHLQNGYTAEVTRLATDGTRNACSMLYRAAWRACAAMGYRRLITYTLPSEGGGKPSRRWLQARRRSRRWIVGQARAAARRSSPDADEAPMGG